MTIRWMSPNPWLLRVALLSSALAFFVAMTIGVRSAEAVTNQVAVKNSMTGTLYNYGWHHTDTAGWSALDFSGPSEGTTVYFKAQLVANQPYNTRWHFARIGSCKVQAQAQYEYAPGSWGLRLYNQVDYLHIANRLADNSTSGSVSSNGQTVSQWVGTQSDCGTSGVHLHHGANLPGNVTWAYSGADTCWGSSGYCPGSSWKQDNGLPTTSTCNGSEGWAGTYGAVSGTDTKYICQSWSVRTNSPAAADAIFFLNW